MVVSQQKILITGAGGQVGSELVELCKERQLNYIAYSSSELDITNKDLVISEVKKQSPSVVINAAAYTAVDRAEEDQDKAYAVNRDGPLFLAEACKEIDALLMHISTDYVFDGEKKTAYTVADKTSITSVYGASKLAGEEAIQATWDKHFILRVSWVFGQYGNNFVKTMLRLANERDELSVVNDQFGAPTSAQDIAELLINLSQDNTCRGIEHFESNPGVTWYDFACEIFKQGSERGLITNIPKVNPIGSDEFVTPVTRPKNSKLASERYRTEWLDGLHTMLGRMAK
ncbi:MAG: dTDP-4-dehydrorhamnose reductase [Pseudomonadales bacterium]|nr:dTDP-4-dehydrorhamnose reductase [Pseudomonadales bacterium]